MGEFREHAGWTARIGYWWIIIVLLIAATSAATYIAKPVWLGFERRAFVASPQYVESRRTELLQLVNEVRGIDVRMTTASEATKQALRLQRSALIQRMEETVVLIPDDAVPSTVHMILR